MVNTAPTVTPHLHDTAVTQHIWNIIQFNALKTQKSLYARLVPPTLQHLSASTHISIVTTDMSLWVDTEFLLRYTSAIEALRNLSACNHLAAASHNTPLSQMLPAALHGTSVHLCHEEQLLSYMNTVPCCRMPLPNEVPNRDICPCALRDKRLCLW
jgi:hypothetical protein